MPKLLIFIDWFFPAYRAGGPIRSCLNLAQNLKGHYDIYILTSDHDLGSEVPLEVDQFNNWVEIEKGIWVAYLEPDMQTARSYHRFVQEMKADVIMVNGLWSFRFSLLPLWVLRKLNDDTKVVVAPRGMLLKAHLSRKHWKKWPILQVLKRWSMLKRITWLATNVEEAKAIVDHLDINPDQVQIKSNFPASVDKLKSVDKNPGSLCIICSSRIYPEKNQHYLLELLTAVPETTRIKCTLVGPRNTDYWNFMTKRMYRVPSHINVIYKGEFKNEDISSVIQEHHLFVLPTLGENFGHAIFEAWAAGRPVLISDRTPWRDLQSKGIGWEFSLRDKSAWIAALEQMATLEQKAFDEMCRKSHNFAKQYSDNMNLQEQYLQLFA